MTRFEYKRYFDEVFVRFEIDNLTVLVDLRARTTMPRVGNDLAIPENIARLRAGTTAVAQNLADKLAVRNRTGPTLPSIPPTRR
jgi:hypothetical protein